MSTRKRLMIPGPIECEANVLAAMGEPVPGHTAPGFIASFGQCLKMMKQVWQCPSGQPFIIAGSGTLAMEMAAANLIEPGDRALVVSSGYFGERYAALLERFGARVSVLRAEPGHTVSLPDVEQALGEHRFKLMTITHVDTSTAVRTDPLPLARLAREYGVLSILDGVCSVGGEVLYQEEWGIDVVLTASQKAIGVPPGLALMVASEEAIRTWKNRKTPPGSYYADWTNWLPVMEAYAKGKPAYFGTPAVNLIMALEQGLGDILNEGLEARFERHRQTGQAFRAAMAAMGLEMIPASPDEAADTLSAAFFPEKVEGSSFMQAMAKSPVVVAGGLLPKLRSAYFRVGHMGGVSESELQTTVEAIASSLAECGQAADGKNAWDAARAVLKP